MSRTHRQRFAEIVRGPDAGIDLGEAALLIAAEEYPALDVAAWLARLDALASEVERRLGGRDGDFDRLEALLEVLFRDHGLRGNVEEYYDPRNSFLNEVLERRLGIPISLAVVCLEVGRRVGVPLVGIGMPGHFLLRHARHPHVVLDPFDGGRFLTPEDCAALLERVSGGALAFHPRLLRPLGTRRILLRMLCNLRGIYAIRGAVGHLLSVLDRILLLTPDDVENRRQRGLVRLQTGDLAGAVEDLERYLVNAPEAFDAPGLTELITEARRLLAVN
jgi:regulator of sirC expression with transglutaminase-like and TPR domain